MSKTFKEIKYFSVAFALGVITIAIGALTYEEIAAITGVGEPWVTFGFIVTWLIVCNRYNAHLEAELRAKRLDEANGKRLSDMMRDS